MSKDKLPLLAREILFDSLHHAGSILYSSHETLKSGDIYLLGFNPGGSGGHPIERSVDLMLSSTSNAYLDESWDNRISDFHKGTAPLQRRVCWLLENIGINPREVCASNLIFFQSRAAKEINYSLADKCWPLHEAILGLIMPKLIIAFGNSANSPYAYLRGKFGGKEQHLPSGHGSWMAKGFQTEINGTPVYVAGLPHLSRYSPIGKDQIVNWLKGVLQKC